MKILLFLVVLFVPMHSFAQSTAAVPPIEPGVSLELAKWRAAHYSDVRYKLNLTLEKMSPVLKGTMEIRLRVSPGVSSPHVSKGSTSGSGANGALTIPPIILDWRKIRGHEGKSTISNASLNGIVASLEGPGPATALGEPTKLYAPLKYDEANEHFIFRDGVVAGENVIKLDFTSPILTSGSAITRYVDKEDGAEYIYSLFVPSDASTAFPVFDQPDLKAVFNLEVDVPREWNVISNGVKVFSGAKTIGYSAHDPYERPPIPSNLYRHTFSNIGSSSGSSISTYVFAFAAGPWTQVSEDGTVLHRDISRSPVKEPPPVALVGNVGGRIYVRKSQAEKFKPHAAEVFRLNREAIKYFEEYFDYKFPFPKYDLVLIPEFPFGGMEHAGATFLRESSIIFPQEPTKNDHISRALLIFHEASHQWFGDTVTMRWFDDLWLKEGFATFTAYKAMEGIMPEMNAWKVFYERVKQAAYQTDSTKGTTPIYQEIPNLSAAKSAYGNIVYNKAPAFLHQAEFYLGEDKFQTAVRAFLKKHEYANAGWEDLLEEFEAASKQDLKDWAKEWVMKESLPIVSQCALIGGYSHYGLKQTNRTGEKSLWRFRLKVLMLGYAGERIGPTLEFKPEPENPLQPCNNGSMLYSSPPRGFGDQPPWNVAAVLPNYQDYGYGIFLLDEKSRDYVLKNIQNEKGPFLRSMMWGALWDSVRESELDPREFVELVVKVLMHKPAREQGRKTRATEDALANARAYAEEDESTTALLLNRVGTAMNYYIDGAGTQAPLPASARRADNAVSAESVQRPVAAVQAGRLRSRLEELLIERMQNAETLGQRITFYRAFLNVALSEKARGVLKEMLTAETQRRGADAGGNPSSSEGAPQPSSEPQGTLPTGRVSASIPLKTKDKFDIVTRLLILGDPDAPKLLAELEKTETSDDAKRYAYAARAGIATAENKAKYWNDFVNNKEISESWIEAAFGPWNSIQHSELTLPYLQKAIQELPNHKRNRKIFFVNGWLGAFIGGQRSEEALAIVNKFLTDNPTLDRDLRLKILEKVDVIERAVKIRAKNRN